MLAAMRSPMRRSAAAGSSELSPREGRVPEGRMGDWAWSAAEPAVVAKAATSATTLKRVKWDKGQYFGGVGVDEHGPKGVAAHQRYVANWRIGGS